MGIIFLLYFVFDSKRIIVNKRKQKEKNEKKKVWEFWVSKEKENILSIRFFRELDK